MEHFGYIGLLDTVEKTYKDTYEHKSIVLDEVPFYIDTLLKMTYFTEVISDDEVFKGVCFEYYVQVPYTLSCVFDLLTKGFYSEAIVLERQLFEILAKLRYYFLNEEKMLEHLNGKRMTISTFFKEQGLKEFYDVDYKMLSIFTHALGGYTLRTEKPDYKKYINGNYYNEELSNFVYNCFNVLVYGFLNKYAVYFPLNTLEGNNDFHTAYKYILNKCMKYIENHKKNAPNSVNWYNDIDKIINN